MQPDFAGAHTTLAAVLRQLGDTEGAASREPRGNGNRQTENQRTGGALRHKFSAPASQRGDLEGAISQFRAAINSSPTTRPAHFELGLALRQQGKLKEAQEEFQKAATLDPNLTPPPSKSIRNA